MFEDMNNMNNIMQPIRRRGAIAISTDCDTEWVGAFIANGSNPMNFGSQLWDKLQDNWKYLERWSKQLLKCGYWEEFLNDGLCPCCGKFWVGYPIEMTGKLAAACVNGKIAPDPNAKYHRHAPTMSTVSSKGEQVDGMWIEWVYILDPKTYNLTILKSIRAGGTFGITRALKQWNQPKYRYFQVGTYNLMDYEPNWEIVEKEGYKISAYYHNKFQPNKVDLNW